MADTEKSAAEKDTSRRTIFIIVALGSALLVAGLVYIATRPRAQTAEPRLEGALRPGSPEFDQLGDKLLVDFVADDDAVQSERALGDVVITMNPTIRNFTGRIITGVELRGTGYDLDKQPVKAKTVVREVALEPNKTLTVPITIEGIQKDNVPASLDVKLTGVRFR
ncbi:MAG TPA: hypothetical protein VGV38_16875 [Pyrinomonadaceae bacterium]|nr:hypothetical protein [Pyrinomonadaceae bacterium]